MSEEERKKVQDDFQLQDVVSVDHDKTGCLPRGVSVGDLGATLELLAPCQEGWEGVVRRAGRWGSLIRRL